MKREPLNSGNRGLKTLWGVWMRFVCLYAGQSILARTAGVTIRASGGAGSSSRISVRGLEGKRIGFFIDEIPLGDQSDFIDLNDIPIDMIDRIEIFKGIVPAKFGGSSMGGAVNIVIKEYPDRYADFSYQRESLQRE